MNVGTLVGLLRIDNQMDEGVRRAMNDAERRFGAGGQAAADRFVRDADGRVRDTLTGKFATAGDLAGTEFAREASQSMGSELETGGTAGIAGAISGIGLAVAGAATAAGVVIGGAIVKGLTDAMAQEAGNDLLAARLNLNPEQAGAAGRAAAELYVNNFGETLEEAQGAIDAVWSTLGDSIGDGEDALVRAGERAITLAQIMEVDVSTAVNTVGAAVRTGLAKDATEGFDLMTAAAQAMPAEMRAELIPAIDEYGTFLAAMGFTGEEAFGLLADASRDGMYGIDKTGDAIKELSIRATDMSTASVEAYEKAGLSAEDMAARFLAGGDSAAGAMDDLVAGLLGIEDPVERANAAIGLFGTPLEDLNVTEIPAFLESLTAAGDGMEDVAGRTDAAASTISDNATAKIETFKRKGLMALSDFIGGKLLPGLERFLDRAAPIFEDLLAAWRTDGFQGVADKLGEIWDKAWPVIQAKGAELFAKVRAWLIENGPGILAGLGDLAAGLWDWIVESWPVFAERMAELYGRVATWFAEVGIPAAGEWLKAAGPALWQWLQDAYPEFVKNMGGLLATIGEWFVTTAVPWMARKGAELWSALGEWLWTKAVPALLRGLGSMVASLSGWFNSTAIPWLRDKAGEWFGKLVEMARAKGGEAVAWLRTLPGTIGSWITGTAAPGLRAKALQWFGKLREAAVDKASDLMEMLRRIPGRALEAIGDLGRTLLQAGRNLIQGLINGITEKIGDLRDTLSGITENITSWKGPPQRDAVLLRPAGQLIMGGLMAGIDDQVAPLRRQLEAITAGIDGDLSSRLAVGGGGLIGPGPGAVPFAAGTGAQGGSVTLRIDKLITQLPNGRVLAEAVDVTVLARRANRDRRGRSPFTARAIAGAG